MTQSPEKPVRSRKGLKMVGIVLIVLTVITTLSAFGTITRMAAIETDTANQLGKNVGALIIPALLGLGAWYSFKRAKA